MEQRYIIDTNTAIDYLDNKLPNNGANLIDSMALQISVITRIELLGWTKASSQQLNVLQQFIANSSVFNLDESVILKTIELRKTHRIKLPDAIIASTAIVYDLTLMTRNITDFKNITNLKVIDPHSL